MGLLEKAMKIYKNKETLNTGKTDNEIGNLEDSLNTENIGEKMNGEDVKEDEETGGLLAKAERLKGSSENMVENMNIEERVSDHGLLSKAEEIIAQGNLEITENPESESLGLLERAQQIIEKSHGEERITSKITELEKETEEHPEEEKKEIISEILGETKPVGEEITIEEEETQAEVTPEVEYEEEETEEAVLEIESKKIDYFSLLKKSLKSENTSELIVNMEKVISEDGFSKLGEIIIDILSSITGGETGLIFIERGDVFVPSIFAANVDKDLKKKYKIMKSKIKKSEKITTTLIDIKSSILSKDKKARQILDAIKNLQELNSWMLVPFILNGVIYGFAIIININEKKRISKKQIDMLVSVFKDKLALETLERKVIEVEDKLEVYNENLMLLNSVRKNILEKNVDINLAFSDFCSSISVEMASLLVSSKDFNEIMAVAGISQESIIKYDISKIETKINKYVSKKKVVLVKDIKPEQFGLVGKDTKKADILVLVPILFQGEPKGILIIHRFANRIKKLSTELTSKLALSSQYLLPLLLNYKLNEVNPVELIVEKVDEIVKWSKRAKKEAIFFNIEFNGMYEVIKKIGLRRFIPFYFKIRNFMMGTGEKYAEPIFLLPDRIAIIIKGNNIDNVSYKETLEENLKELIKSQRTFKDVKLKVDFSTFPDQIKDIAGIFNFFSSYK